MGGHHHGGAARAQPVQGGEQPLLPVRVEPRGRLVEDQHPGPHRDRPRDRGPLALPVRQQVRGPLGQSRDVQRGQRLPDPGPDLRVGQAEVQRTEGHVLADRGREELVVRVLHHQLHRGPQPGQPLAVVGHRLPAERQRPRTRPQSAAEQPHQRGLATAVAAEQRQRPPLAHREVQARQHVRTLLVRERRAPQGDQGRGRFRGLGRFAHDRGPSSTRVRTASAASSATLAAVNGTDTRASGTSTRRVPS